MSETTETPVAEAVPAPSPTDNLTAAFNAYSAALSGVQQAESKAADARRELERAGDAFHRELLRLHLAPDA